MFCRSSDRLRRSFFVPNVGSDTQVQNALPPPAAMQPPKRGDALRSMRIPPQRDALPRSHTDLLPVRHGTRTHLQPRRASGIARRPRNHLFLLPSDRVLTASVQSALPSQKCVHKSERRIVYRLLRRARWQRLFPRKKQDISTACNAKMPWKNSTVP